MSFTWKEKPNNDQHIFERQSGFTDKVEKCAPLALVEYTQYARFSKFFLKIKATEILWCWEKSVKNLSTGIYFYNY